jgi:Protein of unknown function (DUF2510)
MSALLVLWAICALAGWAIGNQKGRGGEGLLLGVLLGIIGIIIVACLRPTAEVEAKRQLEVDQAKQKFLPVGSQSPQPSQPPQWQPPIQSQPPPGWYPSPSGGGSQWWDGNAWTPHRQPDSAVTVTPGAHSDGWS